MQFVQMIRKITDPMLKKAEKDIANPSWPVNEHKKITSSSLKNLIRYILKTDY